MNDSSGVPTAETPVFRWKRLAEWLLLAIVVGVLIALLLPETQWVADGRREVPVQVFVFDIETGQPVSDAEVSVFSFMGYHSIEEAQERATEIRSHIEYAPENPAGQHGRTNHQRVNTLQHTFSSDSSDRHPNTRIFPSKCWVSVSSPGYGGVAVSLGTYAIELGEVKRGGGVLVPIGISKCE